MNTFEKIFDTVAMLVVTALLCFLTFSFASNECHKQFYQKGETEYTLINGCTVKVNGFSFPQTNLPE